MSKVLRLKLKPNRDKPLFTTITKYDRKILCLFDTGATMPVWCSSEGLFKIVFPDAILLDEKFVLSGFGKTPEIVNVYKIPVFYLKDDNSSLEFRNLHIATSFGRSFGCDLILSYTMFTKMDCHILNRNLNNAVLQIDYDKDIYNIGIMLSSKMPNIVHKIYNFSLEEQGNFVK